MEEIFRKFSSRDGKMSKVGGREGHEKVGRQMADAFYPFVGEGPADIPGLATPAAGQQGNVADTQPTPAPGAVATQNPTPENSQIGDPMATPQPPTSPAHAGARPETTPDPKVHVLGAVVSNPARIAVFDDPAAAPRVVVVQPKDIRTYLEEVTATVTRLAKEQGGRISFTVIREVVENLVHAYFIEPTISILDGGNTIRFSDQGPGISEKSRALEYGTTSATEEMKRYIRGVGSGLPYAQQYMEDHGGTLTIEDNIHSGTIVTISLPTGGSTMLKRGVAGAEGIAAQMANAQLAGMPYAATPMPGVPAPGASQMMAPQRGMAQPANNQLADYPQQDIPMPGYPQQVGYPTQQMPGYQQQPAFAQQGYAPYGYPQPHPYGTYQPAYQQVAGPQQAAPEPPATAPQPGAGAILDLSDRAQQVLEWLAEHESVGPTDLTKAYGGSLSTWTRQLQELEDQGILRKRGQKRYLTSAGRTLI